MSADAKLQAGRQAHAHTHGRTRARARAHTHTHTLTHTHTSQAISPRCSGVHMCGTPGPGLHAQLHGSHSASNLNLSLRYLHSSLSLFFFLSTGGAMPPLWALLPDHYICSMYQWGDRGVLGGTWCWLRSLGVVQSLFSFYPISSSEQFEQSEV